MTDEELEEATKGMRLVDCLTGETVTWEYLMRMPTKAQCMAGPEDEVAEENQQAANPDTGDTWIELPEPGVLDE